MSTSKRSKTRKKLVAIDVETAAPGERSIAAVVARGVGPAQLVPRPSASGEAKGRGAGARVGRKKRIVSTYLEDDLFQKLSYLATEEACTRSRLFRRLLHDLYLEESRRTQHYIRERFGSGERVFSVTLYPVELQEFQRLSEWWTLSESGVVRYVIHQSYQTRKASEETDVPGEMRKFIDGWGSRGPAEREQIKKAPRR